MEALLLFERFIANSAFLKMIFQLGLFALREFLIKEQHNSILIFFTFRDCHKIKYRDMDSHTALR